MVNYRNAWSFMQGQLRVENLVFLDETSISTAMTRRYGRCPLGERLVAKVLYRRYHSFTFLMGLRHDGLTAPFILEGAMTGDIFAAYLEQHLAPVLKPDDIVIMDNLPAHKTAAVRKVMKDKNINHLYLPPYSPDYNPIEMAFSKLKSILNKAGERTKNALEIALVNAIDSFKPNECLNFFKHQKYGT